MDGILDYYRTVDSMLNVAGSPVEVTLCFAVVIKMQGLCLLTGVADECAACHAEDTYQMDDDVDYLRE